MERINWTENLHQSNTTAELTLNEFKSDELNKVKNFHASMPQYSCTPLHKLNNLANQFGVKSIDIKDESQRFGLKAFKGLGGSYAVASYFAKRLNLDLANVTYEDLMSQINSMEPVTFATVTAGNHGKGVAWAAKIFKQKAKVILPSGSSDERLKAIQELGAEAYISDLNYDDAVTALSQQSEKEGWILIQDTAWEGYNQIPLEIMKGYSTIVAEIIEQIDGHDLSQYSHVFLQAGVGSFAAAMVASIYKSVVSEMPKIVIAEPSEANCLYLSAKSKDGEPNRVYGDLDSMMAGLACGEPNPYAWEILKNFSDSFFSCTDDISAIGMRTLANPINDDTKIISGESGALPLGLLHELMTDEALITAKQHLNLNKESRVLIISTEGDTNPKNYKEVINNN